MVESQQKLLSGLENDGYEIKRGRIVYDTAIIVSSDTDLIPAIKYARSKGKMVEYVGFSSAPSLGMIKESDDRVLLLREQLEIFI